MEFHMINIMYALIPTHAKRKYNIFMQRRLYIDEVYTALDIFHFAVFFIDIYYRDSKKQILNMLQV